MYKSHKPLKINVISDIHFFAKSLGIKGPGFEKENAKSANDLLHSEEILHALGTQLLSDEESEFILVSGDVTFNGEPESHEAAINFLNRLKAGGKRVYVITATHDFQDEGEYTKRFTETGAEQIEPIRRHELWDMYYPFGPNEALSVHRESMSYVVQLCDGYRLFALNDDKNLSGGSGFSDECFKWIAAQVADAKKNNQFIITMTHHPMISPSPMYNVIGESNMMTDARLRLCQLADMGVPFVLTGHTHVQDISYAFSENGNIFYDITTPSATAYPGTFRTLVLDPAQKQIQVLKRTIDVRPDFEFSGSLEEHFANKFFGMIRKMLYCAGYDTEEFARMATAISIDEKLIYKIGWLIRPFARLLNKLKIKHVARLCRKESGVRLKGGEAVGEQSVLDFVMSLAMNLYGGNGAYTPETAYYKITMGVVSVFNSILSCLGLSAKKLIKKADSLEQIVEPLLYNSGIDDHNAVLKLYPLYSEDNRAPEIDPVENRRKKPKIKKSKKGPAILALLAVLILLLWPVILLWLGVGFVSNRIKYADKLK